jgi:hypothetical protein
VVRAGRPPSAEASASLRECRHHGLVPHGYYGAGKGTARWRCKRCIAEDVTRRHQKMRALLVAEAGGACAVCGYDRCPLNLHFHHVEPARKSFSMHMGLGKSLAAYRSEAVKCVLVCANCHGEIEAGMVASPPAGSRFGVVAIVAMAPPIYAEDASRG